MTKNESQLARLCAWAVAPYFILFGIGWGLLGRMIPPYPASMPAEELAQIYRDNASTLRIGFALAAFATTFFFMWSIGLFRVMLATERGGKILSYTVLVGGVLTGVDLMFSCFFWLTAAFRPEQDPALIQLLYDLGWMWLDLAFGVAMLYMIGFGVIALRDTREKPLFPKWLAWLGIWLAMEFLLELIMPYFRSGPFSWSGLFNFWVPFFPPATWMVIVSVYMYKAAKRLNEEYESEIPRRVEQMTTD